MMLLFGKEHDHARRAKSPYEVVASDRSEQTEAILVHVQHSAARTYVASGGNMSPSPSVTAFTSVLHQVRFLLSSAGWSLWRAWTSVLTG